MHDRNLMQLPHAVDDLPGQRLHESLALRARWRNIRAAAPREEVAVARELHDDVSCLLVSVDTQQRANVLVGGMREKGSTTNADPRLLFLAAVLPVELFRLLADPRIRDLLHCNLVARELVDHMHHLAMVAGRVLDLADHLETHRLPSLHVAGVERCRERLQACARCNVLAHAVHLTHGLHWPPEGVDVLRPMTRGLRLVRSRSGPDSATR
eukprot:CAMPEP_0183574032 /NCGR_PEP_ID=MMETSP0371-20130417/132496_1 /TAXON_ID=268820 /ORGANISM="Peridinium aciculiferum, Strain PAER-2" /LENGTH=210 /DNA_ID=CAMNT_0025784069 /DNA_START=142 /DNA_END=770 /DNA_ORIENTATION=+